MRRHALLVWSFTWLFLGNSTMGCSRPYSCDLRSTGELTCIEYVGENPFDDGWVGAVMPECHRHGYRGGPPGTWSHEECSRAEILGGCTFPLAEGGKTIETTTWYYPDPASAVPLRTSADVMNICSLSFRAP